MRIFIAILAVTVAAAGYYFYSVNDTSADLDERWASFSQSSQLQVDHGEWQLILDCLLYTSPSPRDS